MGSVVSNSTFRSVVGEAGAPGGAGPPVGRAAGTPVPGRGDLWRLASAGVAGGIGGDGAVGQAIGVFNDPALVTTGVNTTREPAAGTFPFQEVCTDGARI